MVIEAKSQHSDVLHDIKLQKSFSDLVHGVKVSL